MINKNTLKLVLGLFIVQLLFACEQDIEIEIKDDTPKIVLNGWLRNGEAPRIKLNESLSVLSNASNAPIVSAEVILFEGDTEVGQMEMIEEGVYSLPGFLIKENRHYKIEVSASDFDPVSAEVTVPAQLDSNNVQISYTVINPTTPDNYLLGGQLDIAILDDDPEDNFFLISNYYVNEFYENNGSEDTVINVNIGNPLNYRDPILSQIYVAGSGYLTFNDTYFSESNYEFRLISDYDLRGRTDQNGDVYSRQYYQLNMEKLSPGLYQYLLTLEDNQYPEAFTEPTQVFSNVKGGYGILGASSSYEYIVEDQF